jgi:peptide-methionine (R)-S-oxide reductase
VPPPLTWRGGKNTNLRAITATAAPLPRPWMLARAARQSLRLRCATHRAAPRALAAVSFLSFFRVGRTPTTPSDDPDSDDMGSQVVKDLKEVPAAPSVVKTDAEWKAQLGSGVVFNVTRQGGTERPFTGEYTDTETAGTYLCVCCKTPIFSSLEKFHSGCGWPAFFAPAGGQAAVQDGPIRYLHDGTAGMIRTEIRCKTCEAHLGHVFNDGPRANGGLRYCVNSVCLTLKPEGGK